MEKEINGQLLKVPQHVAIILDGNGRWAKKHFMPRNMGHSQGAKVVEQICEEELGGLGIAKWTTPKGGYFISFESLEGCAKAIVARCAEAGVKLTPAGATYPYGKDPHDSNIRIAPSFPTMKELIKAGEIFTLSVKLVSLEKYQAEAE